MHKRTKGYTLLLLLVLTGLAGRQSTTTITSKERRFLIEELKESRAGVQKSIKGLSEQQLNFKSSEKTWSINERLQQIALAENNLWSITVAALKTAAIPGRTANNKIKDEHVLEMLMTIDRKLEVLGGSRLTTVNWKASAQTLDRFKEKRAILIKYAKTSTDDMRSHMLQMPVGAIDTYQMLLYISAHTEHHTLQIEEVKAHPAFPK